MKPEVERPFLVPRILGGLTAIVPCYGAWLIWWGQFTGGFGLLRSSVALAFTTVGALGLGFAFFGHDLGARRRLGGAALGGVALAGVAGVAGFLGPTLIPSENDGRLVALCLTGPLGFVVGAFVGFRRSSLFLPGTSRGLGGWTKVAITRDMVEAGLMQALLVENGLHPLSPGTEVNVVRYGGESSHHVEVPAREASAAIELLRSHGFEQDLIRVR